MNGTYLGIEHYGFTERCPDVTDRLDATVTWDDTTTWTYTADYCGENRPDGSWHGKGTVEFVAADGAKVHGEFEHVAPIGTAGDPYEIRIIGGTGRFVGASGTCPITVAIRPVRFGEQEQSGSLKCILA